MAIAARTNARQGSRRLAAVARSRRCEAIARRNAAEDAEQWFKDMSGAACGARLRASAAGGCGPHGSRSRTTATTANRSQTPRQTGVVNWRQRRSEIGIVFRQAGKTRIANTGFSRASRSSALRRLAKLAPPASARKYLQHCSQNRTRRRLAQLCELPRKQQIPLILPRHYTASGLLNLHTSLTRALTPVTPGVKLPEAKIARKSHAT